MPRAEREGHIVRAAGAAFEREGYAGASLSAIAADAGISKPLVVEYFGSKEQLYARCVDEAGARLVGAVGGAAEHASTTRALATLRAIFADLEQHPHDWGLIYGVTAPPGTEAASRVARYRRALDDFGFAGVAATVGGDDLDESLLAQMWFATLSAVVQWWRRHPDQSADDMAERCARLLTVLSDPP